MLIIQKCGVGRLFMYWNEVSSVHQGYIYLRKKKIYIYIIYSCALFRMFLEIILICWSAAQKHYLLFSKLKTVLYLYSNRNLNFKRLYYYVKILISIGEYIPLDMSELPLFWLAYLSDPSDSGRIHSNVRQRWLNGKSYFMSWFMSLL